MAKPMAIKGALMINGTGGPVAHDPLLIVRDGKIAEIGFGKTTTATDKVQLLDLSRFTLMPGMMDLHIHMAAPNAADYTNTDAAHLVRSDADMILDAARNARLMLEAGFTTVRDFDWITPRGRNFCAELAALRDSIAQEKLPGPRVLVGGFTHVTASHFDRVIPRNFERDTRYLADGPWAMRRLVRLNMRNGADFIKTCISGGTGTFDRSESIHTRNVHIDELKALVDEAHGWEALVAAHAHSPDAVRMALEARVDTIEHCVLTDDDAIERLVESEKYTIPTLAFREQSVIEQRKARGTPEFVIQQMLEKRDVSNETFQRYHEAGVRIAMGTDTHVDPPFGENARELEVYVSLGMTPMEAIQAATKNAAEAVGMADRLGTLEVGKLCDLVAIMGNPIEDIKVLRKKGGVAVVIKEGKVVIDHRNAMFTN